MLARIDVVERRLLAAAATADASLAVIQLVANGFANNAESISPAEVQARFPRQAYVSSYRSTFRMGASGPGVACTALSGR